jgi:membrane-associated phospholipid phosphatase
LPLPARAQTDPKPVTTSNIEIARDTAAADLPATRISLFSHKDLLLLGGLLSASAIVMPLDRGITGRLHESSSRPGALRAGADFFNRAGHPGVLGLSVGALAIGHLVGSEDLADAGLHASMAVVTSGLLVMGIKSAVGRQRPFLDAHDSDVFAFGAGMGNDERSSFPSGHTAAAFALATVASEELARIKPGSEKWARPLFYGGAGLVGLARIYDSRHWASDVLVGAGIGTFIGLKVTRLAHGKRNNHITTRMLETMSVSPSGSGVTVGWTLPAR